MCKQLLGLEMEVSHETDCPVESLEEIYSYFFKHMESPLSLVNFPYYGVEKFLNYNKLSVVYEPRRSETKEIRTVVEYSCSEAEEEEDEQEWSSTDDEEMFSGSSQSRSSPWKKIQSRSSWKKIQSRSSSKRSSGPVYITKGSKKITKINLKTPTPLGSSIEGNYIYFSVRTTAVALLMY